jgi:endonuclease/exonuclease/phosphatase family metal-dependent hydrolase
MASKKNVIIGVIVVIAITARIVAVIMSEREKAAKQAPTQAATSTAEVSVPASKPVDKSPAKSVDKPIATASSKPGTKPTTPPTAPPPSPFGTPTKSTPSGATTIRIGTWNIEWLGQPTKRSGKGQGFAQTPEDMADYIAASKTSILALEEVLATGTRNGTSSLRSNELDAAFAALKNKTGETWEYVLNAGKGNPDDQLTGVAWNTARVSTSDASAQPWRLPIKGGQSSQGSGLWNRPPHAMKFSFGEGKTDIVMIVLHMKADYNGDFAVQRSEEAKALIAVLPGVESRFKDRDVVLLGDLNTTSPGEACLVGYANAGYADLNPKNEQTHWRGGATDRIFVPESQPEFKGREFEVMSDRYLEPKRWDPGEFKKRLSDHYIVVTTIAVMNDDD